MPLRSRQLRSTISADRLLTLSLDIVEILDPGDDEIIVRVEAAPLNPSDIGLMLGPADISTMAVSRNGGGLVFEVPAGGLDGLAARIDKPLSIGTEAAGTVVAAGRNARALEGRLVGMSGGAMYADYRKIGYREVVALPGGVTAAQGASMFVNPFTALGFVETVRSRGHHSLVHTAAASNLGQMLQKICTADGLTVVNIVRSVEQVAILRNIGATHVLNSNDDDFIERLVDMLAETGATIAFDAIGGGQLGGQVLRAMERAAAWTMTEYSRYGSNTSKQLFVYGALDASPTVIDRSSLGYDWSVAGWLVMPFLQRAGEAVVSRMRSRVVNELSTTFASKYSREIGLAEALKPDVVRSYDQKSTGDKFLINPVLDH